MRPWAVESISCVSAAYVSASRSGAFGIAEWLTGGLADVAEMIALLYCLKFKTTGAARYLTFKIIPEFQFLNCGFAL